MYFMLKYICVCVYVHNIYLDKMSQGLRMILDCHISSRKEKHLSFLISTTLAIF